MFNWLPYRIIAYFSQSRLRHFWLAKWQCDRFLSESLEFLLSVLFYRVVNLKVAHSLAVCSYVRNMARARTFFISLISPLLCACIRAKGAFLIRMTLSLPECVAYMEIPCAFFECTTLYKCSMFVPSMCHGCCVGSL